MNQTMTFIWITSYLSSGGVADPEGAEPPPPKILLKLGVIKLEKGDEI